MKNHLYYLSVTRLMRFTKSSFLIKFLYLHRDKLTKNQQVKKYVTTTKGIWRQIVKDKGMRGG